MYQGGDTTQFQRLLDGWAAGDEGARTELLERAAQRLLILTRRMFRNYPQLRRWEETDDVFQNAILRLYRSLGDVRPDSVRGFFALAATQIRRTLIDLARHHFGPEGSAAHHHSETRAAESGSNSHDSRLAGGDERPETLDAWARFHEAVELLPASTSATRSASSGMARRRNTKWPSCSVFPNGLCSAGSSARDSCCMNHSKTPAPPSNRRMDDEQAEIRMSRIRRGGTKDIPKHEARSRGDFCADFGSIGHSCSLRPAAAGLRQAGVLLSLSPYDKLA